MACCHVLYIWCDAKKIIHSFIHIIEIHCNAGGQGLETQPLKLATKLHHCCCKLSRRKEQAYIIMASKQLRQCVNKAKVVSKETLSSKLPLPPLFPPPPLPPFPPKEKETSIHFQGGCASETGIASLPWQRDRRTSQQSQHRTHTRVQPQPERCQSCVHFVCV